MHLSYSKIGAASVAMVLSEMEDNFQKKGVHEKEGMPATPAIILPSPKYTH